MVLDASLFNTQHYKVQIKSKCSNPGKGVVSSPIEKGAFRSSSNFVSTNLLIYLFNTHMYLPNPSFTVTMQHKINFFISKPGLNSKFTFLTGCFSKAKKSSLLNYLPIAKGENKSH